MSDDMWDAPPPALGVPRPHLRQLTNGAKKKKRTYGKDRPEEYTTEMSGRLVIIEPTKIERQVPNVQPNGEVKYSDRITANIHVLDGTPITEGLDGFGEVKTTFKEPLTPPFVIPNQYISGVMIVQQLEEVVGTGFRFGALGTLPAKGKGRPPYIMFGADAKEMESAREYWSKRPDPFDVEAE